MLKTLFFILGLSACAKHGPASGAYTRGLLGFAGENFSSTNSPCLDGVLTGMDHACAVPITVEESRTYVMMQCIQTRPGAPGWNKYIVMSITDPTAPDLDIHNSDAKLICVDPYARVYIQKRP